MTICSLGMARAASNFSPRSSTPAATETFHLSHPFGPDLHQPENGNGQNDAGYSMLVSVQLAPAQAVPPM